MTRTGTDRTGSPGPAAAEAGIDSSGTAREQRGRRKTWWRRGLLGLAALTLIVVALATYVAASAATDLLQARRALGASPEALTSEELARARTGLGRAAAELDSTPARLVGWLPLVRQNFAALRAVANEAVPVVDAAGELKRVLDDVEEEGFVADGRVRLDLLDRLHGPLDDEARALHGLAEAVAVHRTGWLIPPLWSQMDALLSETSALAGSADSAARLTGLGRQMLGGDGDRTYLVAMMNNTELRGAGGILSGVGSITFHDGAIEVGDFYHYKELADPPPYRRVAAPVDFQEHFHYYRSDTTRWVTTTASPDVPDVAAVALRLFSLTAGIEADGMILADPRGLAAMLPNETRLEVPTTGTSMTARELPDFVYRRAYQQLGGAVSRRRDSLIDIGEVAIERIAQRGFNSMDLIRRTAGAFGGGHLAFVSLDPEEQRALDAASAAGDLGTPASDAFLATVQNLGGNKLDSYAERAVRHVCRVREDSSARCLSTIQIANHTPEGLTRFEYQYKPYGLFKNYVEIYLPQGARLLSVTLDGRPANFDTYSDDGFLSVGVFLRIPRSSEASVTVAYDLPGGNPYSLRVRPQPLVHDARLTVQLEVPSGWTIDGPDGAASGSMMWHGDLDRTVSFRAAPSERTGLPAAWSEIARFWSHPIADDSR